MYRSIVSALILVGVLTGCGAAAPSASAPTSAPAVTAAPDVTAAPVPTGSTAETAAPSAPVEETAVNPTTSSVAPEGSAEAMAELAKKDLAERANVDVGNITVVSVTEMEWNDSSLGCAQPDQAYMQVITPGYLIILAAKGNTYQYNTNRQQTVVFCEQPIMKK